MAYQPPDFLQTGDLYTEEERIVASNVRAWVSREAIPAVVPAHREGTFPTQLVAPMAQLGLLGPTLSGYGCAGAGYVAYGLMMRELERGDSGRERRCVASATPDLYDVARIARVRS